MPIIVLFIYVVYFGLCYLVGKAAESRCRSFWLWFVVAVLVDPLIGYIILRITNRE